MCFNIKVFWIINRFALYRQVESSQPLKCHCFTFTQSIRDLINQSNNKSTNVTTGERSVLLNGISKFFSRNNTCTHRTSIPLSSTFLIFKFTLL